jgi:hypothetical protein
MCHKTGQTDRFHKKPASKQKKTAENLCSTYTGSTENRRRGHTHKPIETPPHLQRVLVSYMMILGPTYQRLKVCSATERCRNAMQRI